MKPPYSGLNPNRLIPTLEDGDFVLTENSAILKYLAEKTGSPAYPKDLKQARGARHRARAGERQQDLEVTPFERHRVTPLHGAGAKASASRPSFLLHCILARGTCSGGHRHRRATCLSFEVFRRNPHRRTPPS